MQLTLVVPGLLDFAGAEPLRVDAEGAPLAQLLTRTTPAEADGGAVGLLCAMLGIVRQRDWPVAPWLAAAANLDPGDSYWLQAELVTLRVGQLDVQLMGVIDDLTEHESAALLTTLNAHFAGDGLHFVAIAPARWLVSATVAPELTTHPADDVLGASIAPFLPTGPDAPRWRRWQSEMQMLLFAHPVSAERERQGRAPINGIWLSRGGVHDETPASPCIASLYADAAMLSDLARARGVAAAPAPRRHRDWIASGPKSPSLVWLPPLGTGDESAGLAAFGRDWADPLRAELAVDRSLELEVVLARRGRAWSYRVRRPSFAARWRSRFAPLKLSQLIADV